MKAEIKNGFPMVPLTHATSVWFCPVYLSWAEFCLSPPPARPPPTNPRVEVLTPVFQNVTIFVDRDFKEVFRVI